MPSLAEFGPFDPGRRRAVRVVGLSPIILPLALNACTTERPPNNEGVIADLKQKLQITPPTTREQFALTAASIAASNPTWMEKTTYEWTTDRGKQIKTQVLPGGELATITNDSPRFVDYPDPRIGGQPIPTSVITSVNEKNHCVVYGTKISVDNTVRSHTVIKTFLDEYFSLTNVPCSLHISYVPNAHLLDLIDVEHMGKLPKETFREAGVTTPQTKLDTNDVIRYVILFDLPLLHMYSATHNASIESEIVAILTNEMTNLATVEKLPLSERGINIPEGISSLAGLLAGMDKQSAQMMLGGNAYEQFVKVLAEEMTRIGKVRR